MWCVCCVQRREQDEDLSVSWCDGPKNKKCAQSAEEPTRKEETEAPGTNSSINNGLNVQSINQSTEQPINQSIDRSIGSRNNTIFRLVLRLRSGPGRPRGCSQPRVLDNCFNVRPSLGVHAQQQLQQIPKFWRKVRRQRAQVRHRHLHHQRPQIRVVKRIAAHHEGKEDDAQAPDVHFAQGQALVTSAAAAHFRAQVAGRRLLTDATIAVGAAGFRGEHGAVVDIRQDESTETKKLVNQTINRSNIRK